MRVGDRVTAATGPVDVAASAAATWRLTLPLRLGVAIALLAGIAAATFLIAAGNVVPGLGFFAIPLLLGLTWVAQLTLSVSRQQLRVAADGLHAQVGHRHRCIAWGAARIEVDPDGRPPLRVGDASGAPPVVVHRDHWRTETDVTIESAVLHRGRAAGAVVVEAPKLAPAFRRARGMLWVMVAAAIALTVALVALSAFFTVGAMSAQPAG